MYAFKVAMIAGFSTSAGIGMGGIRIGSGGSLQHKEGKPGRGGIVGGVMLSGAGSVGSVGIGILMHAMVHSES